MSLGDLKELAFVQNISSILTSDLIRQTLLNFSNTELVIHAISHKPYLFLLSSFK